MPAVDLERRARMYAALGEPVRLAIVDHLALEDAAPGELAARFDLPSNLLAHHLNVLDGAGLVRRVRSEGDRRRQYVQVRWDDPAVAALMPSPGGADRLGGAPARLVFVCTANSARSQLAAAVWQQVSTLPVASAGTRPAPRVNPAAVAVARRHGLDLGSATTTLLADLRAEDDLLVAVCDNAHEELVKAESASTPARTASHGRLQGSLRGSASRRGPRRRLHWHVADPVPAGTPTAFEAAYTQITERVTRLAAHLHGA